MKIFDSDIDTDHLDAALEELHGGNTHRQYGALLYTACCVAAGDSKNGVDTLKRLVARGKELMGASPENFDVEIGRKIARSNARDKI